MFAVVVTFTLKPEKMTVFLPLMKANAAASVNEEPGCHQFDVATDPTRPDEVFLYEVYTDATAFNLHLKTPHFQTFAIQTDPMIADKTVKTYAQVTQ